MRFRKIKLPHKILHWINSANSSSKSEVTLIFHGLLIIALIVTRSNLHSALLSMHVEKRGKLVSSIYVPCISSSNLISCIYFPHTKKSYHIFCNTFDRFHLKLLVIFYTRQYNTSYTGIKQFLKAFLKIFILF